MLIARVIGDVSATRKDASHEGRKILLVQPLDLDGSNRGVPVVAVDTVNAGLNDRVLLVQDGFAAFSALGLKPSPIDTAVLGVIDQVELISDLFDVPPAAAATPPSKKQNKKHRT
ncbi:MAG: EutN/CcmL family microcompartment protein [Bryobacterales bacterium]|nr:EutN/CcmL family microcompartment protein [Bryobacterales bacterium]